MKHLVGVALFAIVSTTAFGQTDKQKMDFVSNFYKWYLPIARDTSQHINALHVAITRKPDVFSTPLLHALRVDDAHRLHAKDYIDGLDFDPVLNAQDPPSRYEVVHVTNNSVSVVGTNENSKVSVMLEVIVTCSASQCHIDNFFYPSQDGTQSYDLLSMLRKLHPKELATR